MAIATVLMLSGAILGVISLLCFIETLSNNGKYETHHKVCGFVALLISLITVFVGAILQDIHDKNLPLVQDNSECVNVYFGTGDDYGTVKMERNE